MYSGTSPMIHFLIFTGLFQLLLLSMPLIGRLADRYLSEEELDRITPEDTSARSALWMFWMYYGYALPRIVTRAFKKKS